MGITLSNGMMNVGHKQELTAGPPFPPTAAENGLSVDPGTGEIVLGSNLGSPLPGMLLNNRQIEMAGNRFIWSEGGNAIFDLDPAINLITLGEKIGFVVQDGWEIQGGGQITGYVNTGIYAFFAPGQSIIGDQGNVGSGAHLQVNNGASPQFIMMAFPGTPAPYFFIDIATGTYQLGDINGITNGNFITINDTTSNFNYRAGGGRLLDLQFGSMVCQVGDIDLFGQGLIETLDGTNTHDVSNTTFNAIYSINGNPGVSGMITAATTATVEGGIITAIV